VDHRLASAAVAELWTRLQGAASAHWSGVEWIVIVESRSEPSGCRSFPYRQGTSAHPPRVADHGCDDLPGLDDEIYTLLGTP